jgi:hypothetical protein
MRPEVDAEGREQHHAPDARRDGSRETRHEGRDVGVVARRGEEQRVDAGEGPRHCRRVAVAERQDVGAARATRGEADGERGVGGGPPGEDLGERGAHPAVRDRVQHGPRRPHHARPPRTGRVAAVWRAAAE